MAISLTIDGKEAALKKGSSIEYVSENRIFTDADDYNMEIELPLAECPQNIDIFGHLTRKDCSPSCARLCAMKMGKKVEICGKIVRFCPFF